jgi:hypothetical protein
MLEGIESKPGSPTNNKYAIDDKLLGGDFD